MSSSTHNRRHRMQKHRGFTQKHRGFTQEHRGFTLTELLIGITIIGILVGLLAVAGASVIGSAREFAVSNEIMQMSQAIESFKTKYGFYPPSFEQFSRETTAVTDAGVDTEIAQFLPYLNKIAPGHQETTASLRLWWVSVGVNLDQRSSLVFWLSGLPTNKQFPLTNPATNLPLLAYDDGSVDRQKLYDFDTARLRDVTDAAGVTLANVQGYEMEYGKTNGDRLFVYRDADSYVPGIFNTPSATALNPVAYDRTDADHLSLVYHVNDGSLIPPSGNFVNPNTFQLICFGLDGDGGEPLNTDGTVNYTLRGDVENQGPKSADNLCNFANGRLDKFVNEIQ